jgi:hypothetical protein
MTSVVSWYQALTESAIHPDRLRTHLRSQSRSLVIARLPFRISVTRLVANTELARKLSGTHAQLFECFRQMLAGVNCRNRHYFTFPQLALTHLDVQVPSTFIVWPFPFMVE